MNQLYLIIVDRSENPSPSMFGSSESFPSLYTDSKVKVAQYLNPTKDELKSRCWTFPQMKEVTSADINLLSE